MENNLGYIKDFYIKDGKYFLVMDYVNIYSKEEAINYCILDRKDIGQKQKESLIREIGKKEFINDDFFEATSAYFCGGGKEEPYKWFGLTMYGEYVRNINPKLRTLQIDKNKFEFITKNQLYNISSCEEEGERVYSFDTFWNALESCKGKRRPYYDTSPFDEIYEIGVINGNQIITIEIRPLTA